MTDPIDRIRRVLEALLASLPPRQALPRPRLRSAPEPEWLTPPVLELDPWTALEKMNQVTSPYREDDP